MSYDSDKRALWQRIQAEAPALAEDMRALREFGYQVVHVDLRGQTVWHIDEPPLQRKNATEWIRESAHMRNTMA